MFPAFPETLNSETLKTEKLWTLGLHPMPLLPFIIELRGQDAYANNKENRGAGHQMKRKGGGKKDKSQVKDESTFEER